MVVRNLIEGVRVRKIIGDQNAEIRNLSFDSRGVNDGGLFFALQGRESDGHAFAPFAEKMGAAAIVCEHEVPVAVTQIIVDNAREAMAKMAANFYLNPQQKIKAIAVTGTNGKTTTTFLIKSILQKAGKTAALVGTSGCYIKDRYLPTMLTTPDPTELFRFLKIMADEKVEYAAIEVSAHALALKKTSPILFEAAAFTNISQDHLDYFEDMASYAAAKRTLFSPQMCKTAAVNSDDALGKQILSCAAVDTVGYSAESAADVTADNISLSGNLSFTLKIRGESVKIKTKLYGKFNLYNCLAAAATCAALGIDIKTIAKGIAAMPPVTGRFNVIEGGRFKFIIDYAHTPDGIKNVLTSARALCRGRLICVFGCGGNRDRSKRIIMGAAASELADFCVLTSDNPRFENPMEIIKEIEQGICGKQYTVIENRKKAIAYAAYTAKEGDVIAVLGKGGERYQEIAGVKYPYDDYEVVRGLI